MQRFLSFLAGATIGGLVGSTVVLLLTPTSGRDVQAQLKERAEYIQLEVNKAAAERRSELEKQLATLRAPQKPEA